MVETPGRQHRAFVSETRLEATKLDLTTEIDENTSKIVPEARNALRPRLMTSNLCEILRAEKWCFEPSLN